MQEFQPWKTGRRTKSLMRKLIKCEREQYRSDEKTRNRQKTDGEKSSDQLVEVDFLLDDETLESFALETSIVIPTFVFLVIKTQ